MSRAVIVINGNYDRDRAAQWARSAPAGCIVEFKQSKRTLDQNARLWACLTEIARKVEWHGMRLPADDWKDIFTAALRKHRFVPGLDANTVVPLGMRTSDMTKQEFGDLLELINAFAAERGIEFGDSSSATSTDDAGGADTADGGAVESLSNGAPTDTAAADGAGSTEAREEPGAAPAPTDWLKSFAKVIVKAIEVDEEFVVDSSKGMFVEGLSQDQRDRAKAIINYARQVCRKEVEKADVIDIIAGKAMCDAKELA